MRFLACSIPVDTPISCAKSSYSGSVGGYFAFPIALVCAWADKRRVDVGALIAFILAILGYMFIYALTSQNVVTHIQTSLLRLIMHTFPFFMFAISMRIHKPVMTS